ncbi:FMN-dependent NADH-azoreductase [Pseudomonas sp. Fl4BN1]|uniref:FMN-dependent NADH-azoreductase n=1 Tax=Pseudomonas sp. Fl4BN1 TaxID=2697651 RepID=UPI00137729B2|nr:NAD(P)H-dependent oxidoreductase [Pseudomonas sp. Fl4BN1]NBF07848.1 FMN-dependent NADH-azoreductase [Pseudomonas sp. Fl4BN1]
MSRVLVLKSSIMGNQSTTSALLDNLLAERQAKGCEDHVVVRDLAALELPVLDLELFQALRGGHNPSQRAQRAVALSDQLIAELQACDVLLIGAPMYNHNVPTALKNWFDLVVRAQVTFKYTESYPQGLVEGVRAVVVSSRGGVHLGQETDALTPYLRSVLGLIGIGEVQFVYAEGLDVRPLGLAHGLKQAREQIVALVD